MTLFSFNIKVGPWSHVAQARKMAEEGEAHKKAVGKVGQYDPPGIRLTTGNLTAAG